MVTSHVGQHSLDRELDLPGVLFRVVFQDQLEMPFDLIVDLQRFLPNKKLIIKYNNWIDSLNDCINGCVLKLQTNDVVSIALVARFA